MTIDRYTMRSNNFVLRFDCRDRFILCIRRRKVHVTSPVALFAPIWSDRYSSWLANISGRRRHSVD